jgi:hypothetical protein
MAVELMSGEVLLDAFQEAVEREFEFLRLDYGMTVAAERGSRLSRFEFSNTATTVVVSFDNYSFELDVGIGRLFPAGSPSGHRRTFRLQELLDVEGVGDSLNYGVQTSSLSALTGQIIKIADLLRKHGQDALRGSGFDQLDFAREASTRSRSAATIRHKAESAWQAQEFLTVIDLYTELSKLGAPAELRGSEILRLKYSEAHSRKQ